MSLSRQLFLFQTAQHLCAGCERINCRAPVQDDWPGGVRQEYLAAEPLTQALLRGIQPAPGPVVLQRVIEDADGVNMLSCGQDDALVFATADTFYEARADHRSAPL